MKRLLLLLLLSTTALATPISDRYAALGGAGGSLGAKTSEETSGLFGGNFQHFENGSIFWHPECGARVVRGLIRDRYQALGWEKSYLGYPVTDEIDLADGSGRVSKFRGGQLMWRSGTQAVTEVRATDLVVDLPFPAGEAWVMGQNNAVIADDSHHDRWAYCWDIDLASGSDAGKPFVAAATARIAYVEQGLSSGDGNDGNVVVQRFGEGRYGAYLHIGKGSYSKQFATTPGLIVLPQAMAWASRPLPASGTPLGEVGDTGTGVGNHHMHFCVTTAPDRSQFAPYESVPVAFRNYSVSTDQGKTWKFVSVGVPRKGQWVRREKMRRPVKTKVRVAGAPQVNGSARTIRHGTVKGTITANDGKPTGAGKLKVVVLSEWGEPLRTQSVDVPATNLSGPWAFQLADVPAYKELRVSVTYEGAWSKPSAAVRGDGTLFDLAADGTATQSVPLKTIAVQ